MNHFEVYYDQDKPNAERKEYVIVRRTARSRYSELKNLLAKLMASFLYFGCSRGELLDSSNERVWTDIVKLSEMLVLDGGGKLDLDRVDDLQLIAIFFTDNPIEVRGRVIQQKDEEGVEHYLPGKIAALYGVNFLDYHQKCRGLYSMALEMAQAWVEEDEANQEKEVSNGKVPEEELEKLATPTL